LITISWRCFSDVDFHHFSHSAILDGAHRRSEAVFPGVIGGGRQASELFPTSTRCFCTFG
jgi:hypothetical protein